MIAAATSLPPCSSLQSDHLIEMEPDRCFTAVLNVPDCSDTPTLSSESVESLEWERHQSWLCNLLGNFLHLHLREKKIRSGALLLSVLAWLAWPGLAD